MGRPSAEAPKPPAFLAGRQSMEPTAEPGSLPEIRLKDLRAGLPPVHILGRIVALSRREVTTRTDGRRRSVLSGLLSDGTATVRFTWWDPPAEGVDRGTVLRAVNAQVREFRARAELSFGWSTKIEPASELELPSVDPRSVPLRRVSELALQDDPFRLEVRVRDVSPRTVTVREERRTIYSGHLTDGSGTVPFTAWVDFRLKPGDVIRVMGGYVRLFRGVPEVTLDERSHVEGLPPDAVPSSPKSADALLSIGVAEGRGTGALVTIEGLAVGLAPPSGIVRRCPTCARALRAGTCGIHGAVPGVADLRARLVLDDGTGAATVSLPQEATEQVSGLTLSQALEMVRSDSTEARVEGELRRRLLGKRFRVSGGTRVDEFGLSVAATGIEPIQVDPRTAVAALSHALSERLR